MDKPESQPSATDELILSVLREVLARQEQLRLKQMQPPAGAGESTAARPAVEQAHSSSAARSRPGRDIKPAGIEATGARDLEPLPTQEELAMVVDFKSQAALPLAPSLLPRTVLVFVVGFVVLLAAINLPIFGGATIARALPDRQSLVIRDGLVLKGEADEIYVIEGGRRRWISSLAAFNALGYKWKDVRLVDNAFIAQLPEGNPIHSVLKCFGSPHIYRIEGQVKRWIKDIPTFSAEGYVWEDVITVDCPTLRAIPSGIPIPPNAGAPPEP